MRLFSKKLHLTELFQITAPNNPAVDIVFVHGLDGHPRATWDLDNAESWSTWITSAIPQARIWSLGYRVRSSNWFGGGMPLTPRARNVLAVLNSELNSNKPIVFICHSYGGLLVKQILRTGEEMGTEFRAILDQVAGIVFLATPHTGSSIAGFINGIGPIVRASGVIKE